MEIKVRQDVWLRSLRREDATEVFVVIDKNRLYLRKWLPWVDEANSVALIENVILSWEKKRKLGSDLVFGVFEDNNYIGNIGLHDMKKHNDSAMIGYWISEAKQGSGIMTDCVRILVSYGFDILSLNRVYIHCADKNFKSRAIPERLGFIQEGTLQEAESLYEEYFDLIVYGMVRRNWKDKWLPENYILD